jgi:uncharacterized protein (TIGR03083 family)
VPPGRRPQGTDVAGPGTGAAALAGWYRHCADLLLDTLRTTSPDAPCWTFGPPPREAAFWFRRQAHEVAVHRWDLGSVLSRDLGYPAALAADGVAEVVTLFFPRQVRLQRIPSLARSLAVPSTVARPGCCTGTAPAGRPGPRTPK